MIDFSVRFRRCANNTQQMYGSVEEQRTTNRKEQHKQILILWSSEWQHANNHSTQSNLFFHFEHDKVTEDELMPELISFCACACIGFVLAQHLIIS